MSEQGYKAFFNHEAARLLGASIQQVYASFDVERYVQQVDSAVQGLELKARVLCMTQLLREHLPADYQTALTILVQSLGPELPVEEGMFKDCWYVMPVARFVEEFGLDYFEPSMQALNAITRRNTAEFAIRPFIQCYPHQALQLLHEWVYSPNAHVRRLVSEGTRTRLPWASQLKMFIEDPTPVLELLTILRDDPSRYVQKSVANNLNDLVKDHSELIIGVLEQWQREQPTAQRKWIIKHAARRLIKAGEPRILELLKYGDPRQLDVRHAALEPREIQIGDAVQLQLVLHNPTTATIRIVVDYCVHYVLKKQNYGKKVYTLRTIELAAGETLKLERTIKFKPNSVQNYYPGVHKLEVRANSMIVQSWDVQLNSLT